MCYRPVSRKIAMFNAFLLIRWLHLLHLYPPPPFWGSRILEGTSWWGTSYVMMRPSYVMIQPSLGEVLLSDFLCVLQVTQQHRQRVEISNATGRNVGMEKAVNLFFTGKLHSVTYDTIVRLSSLLNFVLKSHCQEAIMWNLRDKSRWRHSVAFRIATLIGKFCSLEKKKR